MSLVKILQLVGFAALISVGQLLFKRAANSVADSDVIGALPKLAANPAIWAALVLYGIATALWVFILRTTPLSLAYPFVALGFIILPILSWWLFEEKLDWSLGIGTILIVCGMLVIALGARPQ